MKPNIKYIYSIIFIIFFFVYLSTSAGKTPYNYFTRLAGAFLQGKYFLTDSPPWLSELVPAGDNRFFVPYPPMPAIISLPLVAIFGNLLEQQWLAHLLGAGLVALTIKLSLSIKKDYKQAIWIGLLAGVGCIYWFLSATGSSWYLGQITAAFFLTAALVESFGKKRGILIGVFLGAAFLSRLQTILALPFFFLLTKNKKIFCRLIPFILFNFSYNYLRFGTVLDKGYYLIPGLFSEPWYQQGLFNLSYIPRHLKIIFGQLPIFQSAFPYILPSWAGLAIWITTPAFIYSFWAPIKEHVVKLTWATILAITLIIFSHGSTGFAQFGYRFAVDFYPFLFFLTIKGVAKTGPQWHHWLLLIVGILVNLWGVIWINKFGWVRF